MHLLSHCPLSRDMDVGRKVPQLPLEILTEAFTFLFCFGADLGLRTLFSLLVTSRYIRAAASPNVIWRPYYQARYTHSVWVQEKRRHAHYHGDYRLQYFARRIRDKEALRLLDDIRTQVTGRGPKARKLVNEFSFDVWDALRVERLLPVPKFFRQTWEGLGPAAPNAFPRRYWAGVAQGIIARAWAVRTWKQVASGHPSVSFEDMIAAFSAFHEWSPTEVRRGVSDLCDGSNESNRFPWSCTGRARCAQSFWMGLAVSSSMRSIRTSIYVKYARGSSAS